MSNVYELKQLSHDGIKACLDKAERYRLLNEPVEAESICLDVLAVDPDDQRAIVTLFLALTDQLEKRLATAYEEAHFLLKRLDGEYTQLYYEAILCERRGGAHHARGGSSSAAIAGDWFRRAMKLYERAEAVRPAGNDDALIRWNTCARILMRYPELAEQPEERQEAMLDD